MVAYKDFWGKISYT